MLVQKQFSEAKFDQKTLKKKTLSVHPFKVARGAKGAPVWFKGPYIDSLDPKNSKMVGYIGST